MAYNFVAIAATAVALYAVSRLRISVQRRGSAKAAAPARTQTPPSAPVPRGEASRSSSASDRTAPFRPPDSPRAPPAAAPPAGASPAGPAFAPPAPAEVIRPPLSPLEMRMPETPFNKTADPAVIHLPTDKTEAKTAPAARKPSMARKPTILAVPAADSGVQGIDCETLASWMAKGDIPMFVDVRGADYKGGQVRGAKHLPFSEYNGTQIREELAAENPKKIVFLCMYGREQSPAAAQNFLQSGDGKSAGPQVYFLKGGFQAWLRYCAKADLAGAYITDYNPDLWVLKEDMGLVYRGDVEDGIPSLRAPSLRHLRAQSTTLRLDVTDHRFQTLDAATLASWIAAKKLPVIVDVRSEDYKGGFIPSSLHIPFASFTARKGEVNAALRENKQNNAVVFICMYGKEHSPTCALKFLATDADSKEPAQVYVLRKGFQDWLRFCLAANGSSPLNEESQVAGYIPEKWVPQGAFGLTYVADLQA